MSETNCMKILTVHVVRTWNLGNNLIKSYFGFTIGMRRICLGRSQKKVYVYVNKASQNVWGGAKNVNL
jgi:hypothetical protein